MNRTVTWLCALVVLCAAPAVAQRPMAPRHSARAAWQGYARRWYAPYFRYRFAPRFMMGPRFYSRPGFRPWSFSRSPMARRGFGWRMPRRHGRYAI